MKFGVLLADPPWKSATHGGRAFKGGGAFDYARGTIPTDELVAMRPEIDAVTDDRTLLLLWVPNSMIPEGVQVVAGWGFEFRTLVPWVKYSEKTGALHGTIGMWVFGASETILVAKRKKTKPPGVRPLGLLDGNLYLEAPRYGKSKKPNAVHELAEQFTGPYLEIFSTERREGWETLGIELTGNDIRDDLRALGERLL